MIKSPPQPMPPQGDQELFELPLSEEVPGVAGNDRIKPEHIDLSDGLNTDTEVLSSGTGDVALGSLAPELVPETPVTEDAQVQEEEDPIEKKRREWAAAIDSLPEVALAALPKEPGDKTLDPRKLVTLMPLIDSMGVNDSQEDVRLIRNLAEMTHSTDVYGQSEEEKRAEQELGQEVINFLSKMSEAGISVRGLVEMTRSEDNMQKIVELYRQNPDSLSDPTSPLGLITRVANLPLHGLASKEEEKQYYANGQGREPDVRDSVISTIIENAEYSETGSTYHTEELDRLRDYVSELETKIPEVQESGFPLEIIGKTLLRRFNPYERINIHDPEHESKIIDRCIAVGGKIKELQAIDPAIAEEVVFGKDDMTEVLDLADSLENMKHGEPGVYRLFNEVKLIRWPLDGVRAIKNCIEISRGIANTPELYSLVKDEKSETLPSGIIMFPKNLAEIVRLGSLTYDPEMIDRFFQNTKVIENLLADDRIENKQLLVVASLLDTDQIHQFLKIMDSSSVQAALDDPELRQHVNEAMFSIQASLDITIVHNALDVIKSSENKAAFPLGHIIDVAAQRWKSFKNDEPYFQELLFSTLGKAIQSTDKDGNLYDSPEHVGIAISFILIRSKAYDNPEAVAREMLAWFETSQLPYAALPTVVGHAEEAEREGVAFEPVAVYKWVYENPERIERVSEENLRTYIHETFIQGKAEEKDVDRLIAEAKRRVAAREDSFRVLMNIKPSALFAVASEGGDIQSMFDNVDMTDRGVEYKLHRSGVEIALGIRSLDSNAEHRVYGSCAFIDEGIPRGPRGYGDIVIVFRPDAEALKGTTFTPEDSFHGASRLTTEDAKILRQVKDNKGKGHFRTDEYIEAQIPGEVSIFDAEHIVATSEEQAEELRAKLPQELVDRIVVRQIGA